MKNMAHEFQPGVTDDFPLRAQLDRLRGITGFISVLGDDDRICVFNRFNHVVRINRLLRWYIDDLPGIDTDKCRFIGLSHDLNRLPFAHNFEKSIHFSQGDHLASFMKMSGIRIDRALIAEFQAFYARDINYSVESRIVYIIDSVGGFIEDFIFAFSTLGFDCRSIPADILEQLGFGEIESLELHVQRLRGAFRSNINSFAKLFDEITFDYASRFIRKNQTDRHKVFDDGIMLDLVRKRIKPLLVEKIFPINNEKVSKGRFVAEKICIPYLEFLRKTTGDPCGVLFAQTDRGLLDAAVTAGIIDKSSAKDAYPNLNI